MSTTADTLDPLIHVPARLQIMVTLATLSAGDALSFARLRDLIRLTPGNLITHLRKLGDADYIHTQKTGNGRGSVTSVALTPKAESLSRTTPPPSASCSKRCRRQGARRVGTTRPTPQSGRS